MDFVLGIILLILIIYSYGRHKKNGQYEIWLEKYNQGIYNVGQLLNCEYEQAKFVIDQFGRHAVPVDVVVEPMSTISIRGESMNGYAFSYNELKGSFTLNDKFEITNLIYNDVDLLHMGVIK